jgi:hypothetical protein
MNTLSFNYRGAGDPTIVHEISDLVREWSSSILCLMETQIAKDRSEGIANSLGFSSSFGLHTSGRSEGLCLYSKSNVNLEIKIFSKYHTRFVVTEPSGDQ